MKKMLIYALPLVMVACSNGKKEEEKGDENKNTPETTENTTDEEVKIQLSFRNLSVDEFEEGKNTDPNAVLLDVRTEDEWKANGIIPGAIMIDWYDGAFAEKVQEIGKDKSVYVYCHGGGRSSEAAGKLLELGYHDVFNLENGFSEWREKGKEIQKLD